MIGRDSTLSGSETTVRLLFQKCTDNDGKVPTGILGFRKVKYYNEIYNVVGPALDVRLKGTPHLKEVKSGTYSHIVDVPGFTDSSDGSYYGVTLYIDFED